MPDCVERSFTWSRIAPNCSWRWVSGYHKLKSMPATHTRVPVHASEATTPAMTGIMGQMGFFSIGLGRMADCCMIFGSAFGSTSGNVVLMPTRTPRNAGAPWTRCFLKFWFCPPSGTNPGEPRRCSVTPGMPSFNRFAGSFQRLSQLSPRRKFHHPDVWSMTRASESKSGRAACPHC